jgi:MinD-like ATPase involved in chromosome partitioning or flagellar assembly
VTGKPIDTEALRRLRRLAASADPRPSGGAVADEAAAGGAVGDEAAVGGAVGDEAAVGGAVADEAAAGGAAVGEASAEADQVEAGVPAEETPAQGAASDLSPAMTSTPAETARMQHRKGQPPRQVPLLPGAESVWPSLSPGAKPVRLQPLRGPGEAPLRGRDDPPTGARETLRPVRTPAPGEQATAAPTARTDGPVERGGTAEEADDQTTGREARTGQGAEAAGREVRVRRVESVVGRDSGGWRRIAQVVVGGGGVRTDGSEIDEARTRGVFPGSRRVVVLGCTGGAGQSTTALMLGHTLASHRDDKVIAVDASTGRDTLTSRIVLETPETLTSLLSGLDQVSGYLSMRGFTSRTPTGLEVIGSDADDEAERRLSDRTLLSDHRLGQVMHLLDRHYKLAVVDPAAALAARVLPYADQLVLVVPASEEAAEAVAMTYEWLDGHGCADLRRRAVMVVNGVSRRSMADVEQAEAVARGRCRAIVRVPWEDDLAPGGADVVDPGQLRAAGRRAYLALAGVVVAGFAAQAVRASEEELASDPPGTRIGER